MLDLLGIWAARNGKHGVGIRCAFTTKPPYEYQYTRLYVLLLFLWQQVAREQTNKRFRSASIQRTPDYPWLNIGQASQPTSRRARKAGKPEPPVGWALLSEASAEWPKQMTRIKTARAGRERSRGWAPSSLCVRPSLDPRHLMLGDSKDTV